MKGTCIKCKQYTRVSRKGLCFKCWHKEYNARPEIKKKRREYMRKFRKTEHFKVYNKNYAITYKNTFIKKKDACACLDKVLIELNVNDRIKIINKFREMIMC